MLFVGNSQSGHLFQWPCVVQQEVSREGDAGQTRSKTMLDKIGAKKQEVEQIVKSYAKTQQELNLRRHDQIGFQHQTLVPRSNIKWSNFSQVCKMDNQMAVKHSPPSPKKESFPSSVLDRKKLKFILCG